MGEDPCAGLFDLLCCGFACWVDGVWVAEEGCGYTLVVGLVL